MKKSYKRAVVGMCLLITVLVVISSCVGSDEKPKQVDPIPAGRDLEIVIATDTHYLSESINDGGDAFKQFIASGDGKQLMYSDELIKALDYQVQHREADIVLFSGDLSNNGEKKSHLGLSTRLKEMEGGGTRVYVVPGNHDVLNPWARKFEGENQYKIDSIGPKEFRHIYGDFGYKEALSVDSNSLSYLAEPSEDVWLLMLDTAQYDQNSKLGHPQLDGKLSRSTLNWILKCGKMASESGARLIAVMHHNLIAHSEMMSEGFTINNSSETVDILRRAGVSLVFSGHSHLQDIASTDDKGTKIIYDVAGGALSVYPHLFGTLHYSVSDHTFNYSVNRLNVDIWAREYGTTDPNLLQFDLFSTESSEALWQSKYFNMLSSKPEFKNFSDSDLKSMVQTIGLMNRIFLSGADPIQMRELLSSEGYQLWKDAPKGTPFRSYIMNMAEMGEKDNINLQVTIP
ncbi:metallophosphoesterase [Paenibacillus sp. BAC0078]